MGGLALQYCGDDVFHLERINLLGMDIVFFWKFIYHFISVSICWARLFLALLGCCCALKVDTLLSVRAVGMVL